VNSNLFFLLSGEHETLPAAEVLAILESENFAYSDVALAQKLLTLSADKSCTRAVVERAGMCEAAGLLIFRCRNLENEILEAVTEIPFSHFLGPGDRFSVRIRRVFGSSRHLHKMKLESKIGEIVLSSVESSVDLSESKNEFVGMIGEEHFVFGLVTARRQDHNVNLRRPKERPAFHPSTVQPRLARCLVNLARAKRGEVLLDPFCGVGGILIEAGVMGCRVVGSDLDPRMVSKAFKNLKHFHINPDGLVVADARKAPFIRTVSIATDPPYGRGASTLGADLYRLLREFLNEAQSMLLSDGFLCLASPCDVEIQRLGLDAGLNIIESHLLRVHRSLTREIVVFSHRKKVHEERIPWNLCS